MFRRPSFQVSPPPHAAPVESHPPGPLSSRFSDHSHSENQTNHLSIYATLHTRRDNHSKPEKRDQTASSAELSEYLSSTSGQGTGSFRRDKASQVLGIPHRRSMEPIPSAKVVTRPSNVSARSASYPAPPPPTPASTPLTSLYVVSGLPKSPHTWTFADNDAVHGLHHTEGAVGRWWRGEVLGSTVSPGVGEDAKKKKKSTKANNGSGLGMSKQDVGKMLSKALKLSFPREVEIIASTLQPASTIHTFTFNLPTPSHSLTPILLRSSVISTETSGTQRSGGTYPYGDPSLPRPSSSFLGPPPSTQEQIDTASGNNNNTVTYHGVCLTVWSHADEERTTAIRKILEAAARARKASEAPSLRRNDPAVLAKKKKRNGPWSGTDGETDAETEGGAASESDFDAASTTHGPGESTLFLPGDTVFWLPYALTLVSRYPIYDLMRDYLTLSWARFSKDVQSHTLQISKILSHPAPRAGEIIKLDASPKEGEGDGSLEVISRMPGGLDFGRGLVDVNFTMWPLFRCLNLDNILTICEIALAPTGRVLFLSRHPAMLGIAVATIKYLVELRGWNGIALPMVHSRDARIYLEDPGPYLIGLPTESRYIVRPPPEVCVCDLDINYVNCASPPPGCVSSRQQRDKLRRMLSTAFDSYFHPDHGVPNEFKEAFPAGRFRPLCKIQAKRGASSSVVAEAIKAPDWWHSTRVIQAFDAVLKETTKKPSFFKRISTLGQVKRQAQLSPAEQLIQLSIRKRARDFVDARDDLETKIGRLSRRLNFLMTESDLWREKFVTFEQYAEKLSNEAAELRSKINKEQRESKRLSGLITVTAQEKQRLQTQLTEVEGAHRTALVELEAMRFNMEKMEEERAQMVAEVEAQIERALASMTVTESDIEESRPSTPRSPRSAATSRPATASGVTRALRSFGTATTLAEARNEESESEAKSKADDGQALSAKKLKRFSASQRESGDGMIVVDAGITAQSDHIAQKVLEIQQKLESALSEPRKRRHSIASISVHEESEADVPPSKPARPPRAMKLSDVPPPKIKRSLTPDTPKNSIPGEWRSLETSEASEAEAKRKPNTVRKIASDASLSATKPSTLVAVPSDLASPPPTTPAISTDDSDTDFQSAYSASPREGDFDSDRSFDNVEIDPEVTLAHNGPSEPLHHVTMADFGKKTSPPKKRRPVDSLEIVRPRERVYSNATALTGQTPSPTMSETNTITSLSSQKTTGKSSLTSSKKAVVGLAK